MDNSKEDKRRSALGSSPMSQTAGTPSTSVTLCECPQRRHGVLWSRFRRAATAGQRCGDRRTRFAIAQPAVQPPRPRAARRIVRAASDESQQRLRAGPLSLVSLSAESAPPSVTMQAPPHKLCADGTSQAEVRLDSRARTRPRPLRRVTPRSFAPVPRRSEPSDASRALLMRRAPTSPRAQRSIVRSPRRSMMPAARPPRGGRRRRLADGGRC